MNWLLGLLTLLAILGGAGGYAAAVIRFSTPPELPKPDYRRAAKDQAKAADIRAKKTLDGMTLEGWLATAISHLMKLWPGITYDWASKEIREYLADAIAEWPSSNWDWSEAAAREAAESYMHDFGEQYGSNQ